MPGITKYVGVGFGPSGLDPIVGAFTSHADGLTR
jgi:hypothetical protein